MLHDIFDQRVEEIATVLDLLRAAHDGWEVASLAAQHLAPITDPEPVADAIQELATRPRFSTSPT